MKTVIAASLMIVASLAPIIALANESQGDSSPAMETMTITYRSAIDYALYQYTIELLSRSRGEIHTSIHQQAKSSTLAISKAFTASNPNTMTEIAAAPTAKHLSQE